jgi:poly-gamma-glutamate capsule biosynthesis protein CapA/YwtB (metallophosphatase superfamily)
MPRACAIELHRGRPIFHSLGNLLFHLHVDAAWPNPDVWEGMIAEITFDGTEVAGIELVPVVLVDRDGFDHVQATTRRWAQLDHTERGQQVLARIAADSAAVGTRIDVGAGTASVVLAG